MESTHFCSGVFVVSMRIMEAIPPLFIGFSRFLSPIGSTLVVFRKPSLPGLFWMSLASYTPKWKRSRSLEHSVVAFSKHIIAREFVVVLLFYVVWISPDTPTVRCLMSGQFAVSCVFAFSVAFVDRTLHLLSGPLQTALCVCISLKGLGLLLDCLCWCEAVKRPDVSPLTCFATARTRPSVQVCPTWCQLEPLRLTSFGACNWNFSW